MIIGDVRRIDHNLLQAVERAEVVLHLAAQVVVTTSVTNPRNDFEVNALGTLNISEAVRPSSSKPIVIYCSTNKVYGTMADLKIARSDGCYAYADSPDRIPETRSLDFCSPYGCSRGTGDQYVHDSARMYGLKSIVFPQVCIYGPHQMGLEDQGWVAWFAIRPLDGFGWEPRVSPTEGGEKLLLWLQHNEHLFAES